MRRRGGDVVREDGAGRLGWRQGIQLRSPEQEAEE